MADETKNQQQGGQTNYGSQQGQQQGQQGQGQKSGQSQSGQGEQSGQSGQKNLDPNKKNPSTGNEQDDQNRDRQRRAS